MRLSSRLRLDPSPDDETRTTGALHARDDRAPERPTRTRTAFATDPTGKCAPVPDYRTCGWIVPAPLTWIGNTCEEDATCDLQPSRDIQWEITVPHGGVWTFSVCDAGADTILYADRRTCCGDEFENDDFCGDASQLTLDLLADEVVLVTLETRSFIACGAFTLVVGPGAESP